MKILNRIFPVETAYAHCDVPCGLYDSFPALMAARTVQIMVKKIKELPTEESLTVKNSFVRMVMTKEEHAQICKKELLILWTDYFKEEHLKKWPDLHMKFWHAAKLCSKNKQSIDLDLAQQLINAVHEIAHIFSEAEMTKANRK